MPSPLQSISPRDVAWQSGATEGQLHDDLVHQLDAKKSGACRDPQGVLSSVICGDDTAVSNACRNSKSGTFDSYVCDDTNFKKLQDVAEHATWDVLKSILAAALFGRVR